MTAVRGYWFYRSMIRGPAVRVLWLVMLCSMFSSPGFGEIIFQEPFDTAVSRNGASFDTRYAVSRMDSGMLIFRYAGDVNSLPAGVEARFPDATPAPAERRIDLSFGGGGTELSNSLFIAYALGPGDGLSLPPFGYGGASDSRTGNRTGYVVRLLRHGDGTNEVLFYRNDTGWVNRISNAWLPSNPVSTLRRAVIRYRRDGWHFWEMTFDTGASYIRAFAFKDDVYPPGFHDGAQVSVKAHSGIRAEFQFRMDTWTVTDRAAASDLAPEAKSIMKAEKTQGRPPKKAAPDPADGDALDQLGRTAALEERYSDAHRFFRMALEARKRKFGSGHPKVAESLERLADLLAARDGSRAEQLYEAAFYYRVKSFGETHPEVAQSLKKLGGIYASRGISGRAEFSFQRALQIQAATRGPDHPDVADALMDLGGFYRNQGKKAAAAGVYRRALEIREKIFGKDHPAVLTVLSNLVLVYEEGKPSADSLDIHLRVVEALEKQFGPDHPDVADAYTHLAKVYSDLGLYAQAETYHRRALGIREKMPGPAHAYTGVILYNLAGVLHALARFDEAETALQRSLTVTEETEGPDHPDVEDILERLGDLHVSLRRYRDAEPVLLRLLAIREKTRGPDHPSIRPVAEKLSLLYKKMKRPKDEKRFADRARRPGGLK
ncbi:tetratricopeptide repeat protein [bacterium]|nr:tetratricopeptide repeat protein [bacterium]